MILRNIYLIITIIALIYKTISAQSTSSSSSLLLDQNININSTNDELTFNADDDTPGDSEDETNTASDSDISANHLTQKPVPTTNNNTSEQRLNQAHANMFKAWMDIKSNELFDLSMNYSGFHQLNNTYYTHLRKDAKYSWINFTEMIINISSTISEVLYNKTIIVKNLSDQVEKAFNEYANDTDQVINSTRHVYYDSKSPKTFCDVAETYKQKVDAKLAAKLSKTVQATQISNTTILPTTLTSPKINKRLKKSDDFYTDNLYFPAFNFDETKSNSDFEIINIDDRNRQYRQLSSEKSTNPITTRKISTVKPASTAKSKSSKKPSPRKPITTTTTTTTTTPYDYISDNYDYEQENAEDESDSSMDKYDFSGGYWDVQCINRTYDENFKSVQKINRNESTVQVPINVYKQDIAINMTAYWTESLDELFKKNYDNDNELFWQYFCSSNGLFRRYPAAYWTVAQKDFFDCRLQTWYIMAAASPKDVLILLDTSGSMTGLRLEIGKKLIEFILDTFTDNDFFNILTFSNTVQYLFNNETDYVDTFIQAGKENKLKFKQRLESYKNTSQQGRLTEPLNKVFDLFNKENLVRSGCNKMIMIITDGHADDVDHIFKKHNNEKRVRVFSFKIGRDMTDPAEIKKLACDNNGEYYHVVTLTDINEHVYEYIPVLSRPMALAGVRETTWSNVFIGYLDKELKIAVARPAFRDTSIDIKNFEINSYMNKSLDFKTENFQQIIKKNKNAHEFYLTTDREENLITNAEKEIQRQQVLLGVVGVDVPVLRLISKVSPKYQMGVGIYIIMLDNNGFIVFHPSIKKEIATSQFDFKGTSHSIDLDKFEIPIGNDEEFEHLEHEMIDQITSNKTLDNWKREGLRVIRRRTEYVYTPVSKTPFSVAIASPSSFGRYYIDLPSEKESDYEKELKENVKKRFDSNIQMYNCSYSYFRLTERLINPKQNMDYCIRYLFQDKDQVLAIKSDLVLHNIYYNLFNFTMFLDKPNLIKSSFYGTYSGITFYLPVTFFRPKTSNNSENFTTTTSKQSTTTEPIYSTTFTYDYTTTAPIFSDSNQTTPFITTTEAVDSTTIPLSTTTMPITTTTLIPSIQSNDKQNDITNSLNEELEAYNMSLNLFSIESNKHTYSFEKQYYTRSIEFSDYLRTEFKKTDEPIVIYFLNESSKDSINETISAALPIWLDKVPTAVAGVVYDSKKLEDLLFYTPQNCEGDTCINICNKRTDLNVTCYLVDEHGIVVLTNNDQYSVIGQPLYKINPWLMLQLELDGLYDLIVTGNKLQDCSKPPMTFNSASNLVNLFFFTTRSIGLFFIEIFKYFSTSLIYMFMNIIRSTSAQTAQTMNQNGIINQIEWRIRNSHCFYFGIYSFNIRKWRNMDSSQLKTWCNNTEGHFRHYLAGYLKQSNLIMLVVENEDEVSKCGSIAVLTKNRPPSWSTNLNLTKNNDIENKTNVNKKKYSINRYRKNPEYCHNYFPNESHKFFCNSFSYSSIKNGLFYFIFSSSKSLIIFVLIQFVVYFH